MCMYIIKMYIYKYSKKVQEYRLKNAIHMTKKKKIILLPIYLFFYFRIMSEITHFRILKLSFMCWQYDLSWEKWFWTWEMQNGSIFTSDLRPHCVLPFREPVHSLLETMLFCFYAWCIFCSSCLTGGQAAGVLPGHPEMGQTVLLSLPVASARSVRETGM